MYVLIITLAPYDVEDDPNLRGFILNDNDEQTITKVINDHYDGIVDDKFHFYDAGPGFDASGVFTTVETDVDEDGEEYELFRFDWLFEVQEAHPQQ